MSLIQVQVVNLEPFEGTSEAGAGPVAFGFSGLAGHEQPVPEFRQVGSDGPLGEAVAGGDVKVVDPGVDSLVKEFGGIVRSVHCECGATEDGQTAVVAGSAEATRLHGRTVAMVVSPESIETGTVTAW